VSELAEGESEVAIVDPLSMLGTVGRPDLEPIA
jgi:hypothetical protein